MKQKTFLATTAIAVLIGSGAMAAQISIEQIGAIWQNPTGPAIASGDYVLNNGDNNPEVGGETVSIFWGDPFTTNDSQSGYEFNPTDVSFLADPGINYSLGTFTHFNETISNPPGSLESVQLLFNFKGTVFGTALSAMFPAVFNFTHNETTNTNTLPGCNSATQISGVPCDDVVTVAAVGGPDEPIEVGGVIYNFTLLGFSTDGGVTTSDIFTTIEGLDNEAELFFSFTATPVPLPAAGWLLLAGVGGLAAMGRRRKNLT